MKVHKLLTLTPLNILISILMSEPSLASNLYHIFSLETHTHAVHTGIPGTCYLSPNVPCGH